MKIAVFGMGYVGCISAACWATEGHSVIGTDVDPRKLEALRAGKPPVAEPGLPGLVRRAVRHGTLEVTSDPRKALRQAQVSVICVGTPSLPSGRAELKALRRVLQDVRRGLKEGRAPHTVILRSTVPPGTTAEEVVPLFSRLRARHVSLAFAPEFLREGQSIRDFRFPSKVIVGTKGAKPLRVCTALLARPRAPFFWTTYEEAELLKYVDNSFHALKIAFANEIGSIAQALELDGTRVMDIFCQDRVANLSPRYLRPGSPFGGSCLPKDLRSLTEFGQSRRLALPLLASILESNRLHSRRLLNWVLSRRPRAVGLIGLTFKEGTDDLRHSPYLELAAALASRKLPLQIYDPCLDLARVLGANRLHLLRTLPALDQYLVADLKELVKRCDTLVVAHTGHVPGDVSGWRSRVVLDLNGIPEQTRRKLPRYHGLAWP